jgi:hypothetical protein
MKIIKKIEKRSKYSDRIDSSRIFFKNEHGIFQFDDSDNTLHKWSDNKGWIYITNETSLDEAEKLIEEMVTPETILPKEIEEPQKFLISNDSILSNEEVMTVVNIVKKATNEWRLFPGMNEEKEDCLQELEHLRYCNDNELTVFFKHSGKIFLNSMPEIIKNKLICKMAFKEAA